MRHPRRKQLRSWLIAFFATLVGLSVAVVVMRPEEGPVASSLYDGPISPGTVARIRIDVRPVGGADFPEELQATAELVSIDRNLAKERAARGQCGMQIQLHNEWWSRGSWEFGAITFGAANKGAGCVGNTSDELTAQVPASVKSIYYRYPFDHLTFSVRAETRVFQFINADGWPGSVSEWQLATPELHVTAPGWKVTLHELPGSRDQTVIPTPGGGQLIRRTPGAGTVVAELTRPRAVQLSVGLFLLILVGVVVSITQVETLGDSLQVAIAVSVLLWTSREALVPGAPKLFLAVDAIFLGLALLVLGNVLILGWRHGAKRADPREGQDAAHPAGEALHSQKPAGRAGADNNRLILLGLAALVVIVAGGRELPLGARHRPGRRARRGHRARFFPGSAGVPAGRAGEEAGEDAGAPRDATSSV
jgi:hypothetical protein